MIYRILRICNAWYGIVVLWICVLAFFLAFALMFVFPQGTLLLLFLGLAGLGLAMIGGGLLNRWQCWLALRTLRGGRCPVCRAGIAESTESDHHWQCVNCGAMYDHTGAQIEHPLVR